MRQQLYFHMERSITCVASLAKHTYLRLAKQRRRSNHIRGNDYALLRLSLVRHGQAQLTIQQNCKFLSAYCKFDSSYLITNFKLTEPRKKQTNDAVHYLHCYSEMPIHAHRKPLCIIMTCSLLKICCIVPSSQGRAAENDLRTSVV